MCVKHQRPASKKGAAALQGGQGLQIGVAGRVGTARGIL